MAEKLTFRLIPRDNSKIITYSGGAAAIPRVAAYLLGRRVSRSEEQRLNSSHTDISRMPSSA